MLETCGQVVPFLKTFFAVTHVVQHTLTAINGMTSARIEALRLQLVELREQEEYLVEEAVTSLMQDVFSGVQGVAESEKLPVLAAINKCGFHMWPGSTLNVGTCGNVDWVPKRLKNMWNILAGP